MSYRIVKRKNKLYVDKDEFVLQTDGFLPFNGAIQQGFNSIPLLIDGSRLRYFLHLRQLSSNYII